VVHALSLLHRESGDVRFDGSKKTKPRNVTKENTKNTGEATNESLTISQPSALRTSRQRMP
jgi:hypothetical protein